MSVGALLRQQEGIATRAQLQACGTTPDQIRAQLDSGRWRPLNESVVCTHNGPLTSGQARWAAVLSAPDLVALCGLTAQEAFGVKGFETTDVHALVPKGARILPVEGIVVVVHESRRFNRYDVLPRLPPVVSIERATIDAASWSPDIKTAIRVAVAPVQQRLTTAARLRDALTAAGQVRFRPVLFPFIADLEGGAEALSEVAFLRWCRKNGFPKPTCQARLDSLGRRRYLDAEFRLPGGGVLRAEIDGGVHLSLATRWADTAKDNDDVLARRTTLRFPSVAIYSDDPVAVRQLSEALQICPRQRGS